MWNPLLPDLARLRQEQRWQEAERARVWSGVGINTGPGARYLARLGGVLIAVGQTLQHRYQAPTYASSDASCSGC